MEEERRIAFIKIRDFSHTNESVLKILETNFPGYQIDVIDILKDIISKRDLLALFFCLKEYGPNIIRGKQSIPDTFFKTPYIFKKVRKILKSHLAGKNYAFTFQTQSLFDASMQGIPHFLYTDHTHLANLKYPGFDRNCLAIKEWIDCEKVVYQNATLNFTMSSNISKSIVEDYSCNPQKVSCVYCGSNIKVVEDENLEESRIFKKNILFVGIDWLRKGGPVLVDAYKKVLMTYPDATLTIVGCSPEVNLPNCRIVGRVPLNEVKKYFEQASVFCLPTTIEPFGIVYLEAMAHKIPVIGSNIGAIPDFIHPGKNGYLIEPDNPEQVSQAIIRLLASPEQCKAFGEYGHKLLWDTYTWEKTGLKMRDNIIRFLPS